MSIQFTFALFVVLVVAPSGQCQFGLPTEKELSKLIARLGAANFRAREQADKDLFKFGDPALTALRQAAATDVTLETKRRIENLIGRIEATLLATEAKNWQTLDAPAYVRDRLVKVMASKPAMTDDQCIRALYLLVANRQPTRVESMQALQELKKCNYRIIGILRSARPLVRTNGAGVDVIFSYAQVEKAQENPYEGNMFGSFLDQRIRQHGAVMSKLAVADEDLASLVYLFVLSRFPDSAEVARTSEALQYRGQDRARYTSELVKTLPRSKD